MAMTIISSSKRSALLLTVLTFCMQAPGDNWASCPQETLHKNDLMVQDEGSDSSDVVLPDLPDNAHYVYHANECFDWGTVGWALSTLKLNLDIYSFFIFMNSSVRGPFLPAYWPVSTCILKAAPHPAIGYPAEPKSLLTRALFLAGSGRCTGAGS